jgi:hypothetical protein
MDSMSAARAAVKYSVVKKSKVDGRLSAMAVNRTVHRGKSVVAAFAALVYASNILADREPSSAEAASELCVATTAAHFFRRKIGRENAREERRGGDVTHVVKCIYYVRHRYRRGKPDVIPRRGKTTRGG